MGQACAWSEPEWLLGWGEPELGVSLSGYWDGASLSWCVICFLPCVQVSTREKDFIVDTIELREHMHVLLDPFTNPSIVKVTSVVMVVNIPPVVMATSSSPKTQVMHGADWDVQWLQRDFGLYLVNLFDTGQASRVLSIPRHSLAFLLQYCCGVQANKQYQLADWRIRLAR